MADDKSKSGGSDRTRINLNEDYEIRYWTKALGIPEERLRDLVREHGNSAEKIRQALGQAA
jgi:hypothetical protein